MAAPTFVAAITQANGTATTVTPTLPAHSAGDTGLVLVWCRDTTQNTFTADQGWTKIAGEWYGTEANENSYAVFKKENLSGSETDPTFTASADTGSIYAAGAVYRGDGDIAEVRVVGTPVGDGAEPLNLGEIITIDGDTLVVALYQYGDDNGSAVTFSGGGLTWTTDDYQETSIGADGCWAFGSATKASAGATGDITADLNAVLTSGRRNNGVLLALAVPASGTQFNQSVGGEITPAGVLAAVATKALSGAVSPAGALVRQTTKLFAAAISPAGAVLKHTATARAGTIAPTGALASSKVVLQSLAGTLTLAGALVKQASKVLSGAAAPGGALSRAIAHTAAGALSPSGAVTALRTFLQTVAGTVGPSGETDNTHIPGEPQDVGGVLTRTTRVGDTADHA